ncbi:MAG: BPSS1780 family membrane protein [Sulfuricella sp.]|nr:BPSS1780 family membrane protein [Sulfuricella sp.]
MEMRKVDAGQGWQWIVDGFALFRKNPPIWITLFVIYFLAAIVVSIIPIVGPLLMTLLAPAFTAGFMQACHDLEQGGEIELGYLVAGFKQNTGQLITVGGLYLVGSITILGLMMMGGGGAILGSAALGHMNGAEPNEIVVGAMGGLLIALLIASALMIPLLMAYWFAPALVMLRGCTATEAMKLSFFGCLRNWLPFLVYGVIAFILMMLAMIPFGLGMLILVPVLSASIYVGYKDIFPAEDGDKTEAMQGIDPSHSNPDTIEPQ